MTRAVVDPGVFVSGLLSRDAPPARLLRLWAAGAFELVASPGLLTELERVLARPKLARRIPAAAAARILDGLRADAIWVADPPDPAKVTVDPADDYLVALLVASQAHVLVSGDRHLTDLAPRIPVVTPRAFVDLLDE